MKYQDENGEFKDIIVKASDTLPIGAIVDYDGDTIPYGWELISDEDTYKKIKKIRQTAAVVSQTVNERSTGYHKVYDVDYINNILGDLSTLTTENKDNLVQSLNETNEKANEIVRGTLNSMNGTTIKYASYFVYDYTLVLTAHITATKDVAQYMPVAVLSNGGKGLSGNAYVNTVDNKNCYLTKATGQIATYQPGGLKTGETLAFVGVFILSA